MVHLRTVVDMLTEDKPLRDIKDITSIGQVRLDDSEAS